MRIVFMGTPEFALPSLNKLIQTHNILCVVTQTDKPKGRGMKLTPPPIKFLAQQLNIPVVQPGKIGEISGYLKSLSPDVIVVVAYGEILSEEILKIPRFGCINLHASLLPELRGPEPIAWSVILGKEKTGLTTMWMDKGVDTGDIILQKEIEILPDDTKGSLEQKMSLTGADFLCETLKMVESSNAPRKKQVRCPPMDIGGIRTPNASIGEGNPIYAPMIKKSDCLIDWSKPAWEIHNLIRGLNPAPSAYTFLEGKRLKIHRTAVNVGQECSGAMTPKGRSIRTVEQGEIIEIKEDEILVATGEGILSLLEIQPEGKRAMSVKDYLQGHSLKERMKFG